MTEKKQRTLGGLIASSETRELKQPKRLTMIEHQSKQTDKINSLKIKIPKLQQPSINSC